jgi:hypothetical protein
MPYHVFLTFDNEPTKERCVLKDLTEQNLKERFVEPFKCQGTLLLDYGEVADTKKVQRFKITLTDEPLDALKSRALEKCIEDERKRNSRESGVVFMNTTAPVADSSHGKDVSSQYIKKAPGAPEPKNWAELLIDGVKRHPVVVIVVAVVAVLPWAAGAVKSAIELMAGWNALWSPALVSKTLKVEGAFFGGEKRLLRMSHVSITCVDGTCKLAGLAAACAKEYTPSQSTGPSVAVVLTDADGKDVSQIIPTTRAWVVNARDYTPIEHVFSKGWVTAEVWNKASSFVFKGWEYRKVRGCS